MRLITIISEHRNGEGSNLNCDVSHVNAHVHYGNEVRCTEILWLHNHNFIPTSFVTVLCTHISLYKYNSHDV